MRHRHALFLLPCSTWLVAAAAHADAPRVEVPEVIQAPVVVKLGAGDARFQLLFKRPASKLCYAAHGAQVHLRYQGSDGALKSERWENRPCLVDPAVEAQVVVDRAAGSAAGAIQLAFYDPDLRADPIAWGIDGERHLETAYPLLSLYAPLSAESSGPLRERVFLSAPLSAFRVLAFDLRPTDPNWLGSSPDVKQLPRKGEPVVAVQPGVGATTDVCTLDGMCMRLRNDFLADRPSGALAWPALGRWTTTERAADDKAGVLDLDTAYPLAQRGNTAAAEYVKAWEAHDACVSATWKKIDPKYDAKRFALVSASGTTVGLDELVARRVRAACNTAGFEKRRAALAGKVRASRGKDFQQALAVLQQRLPADPAQWPAAAAPAPSAQAPVGIGVALQSMKGRVYITKVLAGTPAEKAGVRAGDFLVAIDGAAAATANLEAATRALAGPEGSEVKLTVERAGKPIELAARRARLP